MAPPIALPGSPPSPSANVAGSSFYRQQQSPSSSRRSNYQRSRAAEIRDEIISNAEKIQRRVMATVHKMTPLQRVLAAVALVFAGVIGILFLVFNERIFGWLEPYAVKWKHTTGGWMILWAITFLTAFPPMIGYSSCGTIAGFVYGIGEGWLIYATATVAGSYCSFIVSRTVLKKYVEKMVAHDKRFAALTLTLKEDGLKLLCMIRLCPLPYSLSNGAMSTFPSVQPSSYALATAIITPKLFIHVFIGSRLAAIAKNKEEMTAGDKALNWASIFVFGTVGAFTGWFIYRRTMQRARQLEALEEENVRNAVQRTGAPPPQFMDDPEAQVAAATLAHEDDDVAFFDEEPTARPYSDEHGDEHNIFNKGDAINEDDDDDNDAWG